jgi:hypothetical protein
LQVDAGAASLGCARFCFFTIFAAAHFDGENPRLIGGVASFAREPRTQLLRQIKG